MADVVHNINFTISGYPDLSGLRAINAGTAARATNVVLDMSQFLNADKEFDPYVNVVGFTEILEAPAPQEKPVETFTPVVLVAAAVCVSVSGAVVAAFKLKAANAKEK